MTGQPIAVDFWGAPDPDELWRQGIRLALVYSGPARPPQAWIDRWLAIGGQILMIFESLPTRAFAGYNAGAEDARYHLRRIAEVGCPDTASYVVVAADTPDVRGYEGQITAYYQGWRSVDPTVRLRISYGGRGANDAAAAGGADLAWGVGTWGYGEGGGPNRMPDTSDAALLQSGNTPGPFGSDLDWVYVPLESLRAWGAPATPTQPTIAQGGRTMEIIVGPGNGMTEPWGGHLPAGKPCALLMAGERIVWSWTSTDVVFGVPRPAADWHSVPGHTGIPISILDAPMFDNVVKIDAAYHATTSVGGASAEQIADVFAQRLAH